MAQKTSLPVLVVLAGLMLVLAGCGDSHPLPASSAASSAPGAAVPASTYTASTGAFAKIAASSTASAASAAEKCNLDAVNGASVGSSPLATGTPALFAGWAASGDAKTVPATVEIVLHGADDYAVTASTGAPRPDVASADHAPALANSGYEVKANLDAVPAGTYAVELRYNASGKAWVCKTTHSLTIR